MGRATSPPSRYRERPSHVLRSPGHSVSTAACVRARRPRSRPVDEEIEGVRHRLAVQLAHKTLEAPRLPEPVAQQHLRRDLPPRMRVRPRKPGCRRASRRSWRLAPRQGMADTISRRRLPLSIQLPTTSSCRKCACCSPLPRLQSTISRSAEQVLTARRLVEIWPPSCHRRAFHRRDPKAMRALRQLLRKNPT